MKYRQTLIALSLVLGLAGCASYSSNYQSDVVYRDGSYYSPAEDSYGDYYYAPEPRDDYYRYDGADYFYGGGYCSVRYSYCPPFWYSHFLAPPFGYIITSGDNGWYDPWGGGFGYGYYYPSRHYSRGHRHGGRDRDHDRNRDHRRDRGDGRRDSGSGGTPSSGSGAGDGSTIGPDEAPIRRFRGTGDPRWQDGADADRGQLLPWRGAGALPTMPAATAGPQRLRYPAAAQGRVRPEPRRMVAEPRRDYPVAPARSSESANSDSGDGDRRRDRRRDRGD